MDRFLLAFFRLFRKRLSTLDIKLSRIGYLGLKASKQATRIGLFEIFEIHRLCHANPDMRTLCKELQTIILAATKSPHNLLPHEEISKKGKDKVKSDLLPRSDLFF